MTGMTRRALLQAGAAGLATAATRADAAAAMEPLAVAAARAGLIFGASIASEAFEDPAYGALYARHTRVVTTDWALKFPVLRPAPDRFDYGPADAIFAFARENRLMVRGHTLVWNEGSPDWLKRLSAREIERLFDAHIEAVVSRYNGRVQSWDVVNEPFWHDHGAAQGYRRGPWFDALGPAYVGRAFRRTAALDRSATLVLNEAHTEHDDRIGLAIRRSLIRLIDTLLDDGVPLQAIGLQAHLKPHLPRNPEAYGVFLRAIAARGLDIYITELDVDDSRLPDDAARRDDLVAKAYADYLAEVLPLPAVRMVVTWQLSDRYSWYRDPDTMKAMGVTRAPRPLPFDAGLQPKPAAHALLEAFRARRRA